MRSSCRMQHAGKYIAKTGRSYAELQPVHKQKSVFTRVVFQFNGNQRAGMRRAQHSSGDGAMFGGGKTRKVNPADARMILQSLSQCACVVTMTIHAHGKRLHSARNLMGFP